MALSPYIANADNAAQPVDLDQGGVAARELRALKQKVNEIQTSVRPVVATGSGNALIAAGLPTALALNRVYYVIPSAANTAAVTLTPGAGVAIPVRQADGTSELIPGQLTAGNMIGLQYTGSVLRLVTDSRIQFPEEPDPGFSFAFPFAATFLGYNMWRVVGANYLAIFDNLYFDGTDFRYIANGAAQLIQWDGGTYTVNSVAAGVAGAVVSITPVPYSSAERKSVLYFEDAAVALANAYQLSNPVYLENGAYYEFLVEHTQTPIVTPSAQEVTIAGLPVYMGLIGAISEHSGEMVFRGFPLLWGVMKAGSIVKFQYQTLTDAGGCFVAVPPEANWKLYDEVNLYVAGSSILTPLSTSFTAVSRYNGFVFRSILVGNFPYGQSTVNIHSMGIGAASVTPQSLRDFSMYAPRDGVNAKTIPLAVQPVGHWFGSPEVSTAVLYAGTTVAGEKYLQSISQSSVYWTVLNSPGSGYFAHFEVATRDGVSQGAPYASPIDPSWSRLQFTMPIYPSQSVV